MAGVAVDEVRDRRRSAFAGRGFADGPVVVGETGHLRKVRDAEDLFGVPTIIRLRSWRLACRCWWGFCLRVIPRVGRPSWTRLML
jgi:hypothetical protein